MQSICMMLGLVLLPTKFRCSPMLREKFWMSAVWNVDKVTVFFYDDKTALSSAFCAHCHLLTAGSAALQRYYLAQPCTPCYMHISIPQVLCMLWTQTVAAAFSLVLRRDSHCHKLC